MFMAVFFNNCIFSAELMSLLYCFWSVVNSKLMSPSLISVVGVIRHIYCHIQDLIPDWQSFQPLSLQMCILCLLWGYFLHIKSSNLNANPSSHTV